MMFTPHTIRQGIFKGTKFCVSPKIAVTVMYVFAFALCYCLFL